MEPRESEEAVMSLKRVFLIKEERSVRDLQRAISTFEQNWQKDMQAGHQKHGDSNWEVWDEKMQRLKAELEQAKQREGIFDVSKYSKGCDYCRNDRDRGTGNRLWCAEHQQYHCPRCHQAAKDDSDSMSYRGGDMRSR